MNDLAGLAQAVAQEAGEFVHAKRLEEFHVQSKDQGSTPASHVVTEVDRASQDLILERLRPSMDRYDLGLLAEESEDNSSRLERDYFWCVDPLDGTLSFVKGHSGYSVSIALVRRDGMAVIGAIFDPVSGDLFHAQDGKGAFNNGLSIESLTRSPEDPLCWIMDRSMQSLPNYQELRERMEAIAGESGCRGLRIIDFAGAALNAAWVTQHASAVYFKLPKLEPGGGSYWDFAASSCLLQEWGQAATDIHGSPLRLNQPGSTFMNEHGVIYSSRSELTRAVRALHRA